MPQRQNEPPIRHSGESQNPAGKRRDALLIAAVLVAAAFLSRDAHAHAGERAFVLLLPTGYYLIGGTLAVAASVALLAFAPAGKLKRLAARRWRIFELSLVSATATSCASFAVLLLLVVCGLTGSRDPLANPLPLAVWTLWWVGFTLLVPVVGNLWVFVNPWSGPCRLLLKLSGITPPLSYPPWLGYWPAAAAFFAFAWFELIYPAPDDPATLGLVVFAYWSFTFLAVALFGEETWLGRAEPFSVLFRFFGGLSPLVFERIDGTRRISCSLAIPGAALLGRGPVPASCVLLILLALASVTFDGLSRTFWWLGLGGINPLEHPGRTVLMARNTYGLLLAWTVLASVFCVCAVPRAGLAVFSIMPIALAYHFSHYLTALLINGQYALRAFGLGTSHVTASFLSNRESVTVIWNLQAGSIVVGHILAVLLARLACAREGDTSRIAEIPLAAAMVLYTLFGLWLISTPVAA